MISCTVLPRRQLEPAPHRWHRVGRVHRHPRLVVATALHVQRLHEHGSQQEQPLTAAPNQLGRVPDRLYEGPCELGSRRPVAYLLDDSYLLLSLSPLPPSKVPQHELLADDAATWAIIVCQCTRDNTITEVHLRIITVYY